jgi:hypothetical protein
MSQVNFADYDIVYSGAVIRKGVYMQDAPVKTVFDVITDFLASDPKPEDILAYHLPPQLQERAHYLLERNGEDLLTPMEKEEMYDFMRADEMMALLKAKIKLRIRQESK